MKKMIFSFLLCMLFITAVKAQSVNGIVLADTANYKVIQVFGGHYQRGFAYGFLCASNIIDIWENYIQPSYGMYMPFAEAIVGNPATFSVDSEYVIEARGIIDGVAYAGYDTTGLSYLDLFVVNFMTDLEGFMSVKGFPETQQCSSLMNWGAATQGTDLNGKAVISHFLDALTLNQVISRNQVVVVHFPTETDEQPWLMTGTAGQMVASQALNNNGLVLFLNTVNGFSAQTNMGYEPMTLTLRKAVEKNDFNNDGQTNVNDVKAAIDANTNGYARGFIVSAIAPSTIGNDSLIAMVAECAPAVPYITYRNINDVDSVDGTNLYAANNFIKRNNAQDYCSRYNNVKDSINHYFHGVNIGSADNKEIMYTQSTQSSCLQFIQVIPENGIFTMSVANNTSPAYTQTPATLSYGYLFNYAGIQNLTTNNTIYVYPNPASDNIFMDVPSGNKYAYFISDLSRKTIINGQLNSQNSIGISALPAGLYFVQLISSEKMLTGKFLKQ
ncbi:MAG: T9SS type A sorting domain-containing protein [Bacteroidales bacterium]